MKRKKAKRPQKKSPPFLTDEELSSGDWVESEQINLQRNLRTVNGIDLPEDLDDSLADYALDAALTIHQSEMEATDTVRARGPDFTNHDYLEWQLNRRETNGEAIAGRFDEIYSCCIEAVRQGFFAALVRYSGEIQVIAEQKLREAGRARAAKASAARSEKAAPRKKAIRDRYLELKRTKTKKLNRLAILEDEFKMSSRHLERIVKDLG